MRKERKLAERPGTTANLWSEIFKTKIIMKLQNLLFAFGMILMAGMLNTSCSGGHENQDQNAEQSYAYTADYICPMHCEGSGSDKAGKCPVCKMDYVMNESKATEGHDHDHEGHDHDDHEGHDHENHEGHDHEGHDHEGHDHG